MKILKKVIGVLAGIFALGRFFVLLDAFAKHKVNFSTAHNIGYFIGAVTAIAVGAIVAFACFKPKQDDY